MLLSDGNDTTGSGQSRGGARRGARDPGRDRTSSGSAAATRSLVERLTSPSTARLGESIEVIARHHVDRRPAGDRRACSSTASWPSTEAVDPRRRARTGSTFTFTPKDPGSCASGSSSRRPATRSTRTTAPTRTRSSRASPRCSSSRATRTSRPQLVAALETERQVVDTVIPEALPSDLAGARGLRLDRARGRPAAAAHRRGDGGAPGLRPRPRAGARDGRRAARVRRRRLHRHAARGDAARSTWASATARSSPTSRSSSSSTSRARWTPATATASTAAWAAAAGIGGVKKTDIGKEAILRAASALTAQDELGVVAFDEHGPLGRPDRAARRRRRTSSRALNAHQPRRPDEHLRGPRPGGAVAQGREGDPAPHHPAHRRLVEQRPVRRRSSSRDEGRRDHALDGRRGRRREPVPRAARAQRRRPLLRRREPGVDPRHLPQGDAAGLRPADRRGAVLPDPDLARRRSCAGIDGGFPSLLGYNGTTAKPAAQTVLVTARDDPLLAQWQYGLGRSVAWTSDSTGRWAKSWIALGRASRSSSARWSAGRSRARRAAASRPSFVDRGGRTYLRVESVEAATARRATSTRPSVALVGPDLAAGDGRPQPGRAGRVRGAGRRRSTAARTPSA